MSIDFNTLAALYSTKAEDIKKINGGNYNQAYEFEHLGEKYILRISPEEGEITHLEQIMKYMYKHNQLGSSVVVPVKSVNNSFVETINDGENELLVTVLKKEPGNTYEDFDNNTISEGIFYKIGRNLAVLHNNSSHLEHEMSNLVNWYEKDSCFNILGELEEAEAGVAEKYYKYKALCLDIPKNNENYGIIHGDLHFSNIIINHEAETVCYCDFDDNCKGFYIMDVAMIFFDLKVVLSCDNKQEAMCRYMQLILQGYNDISAHEKAAVKKLENFLKLLEISLYIQYSKYYDENDTEDTWLNRFCKDRRKRIIMDIPYLD
ncbi:MAG: aminoglycoside phosphotransferase family protein [Bacillota bacterium]